MTNKTMWVKAAPLKDPALAGKARVYKKGGHLRMIDESTPLEVPRNDPYYIRKMRLGELIEAEPPRPSAPPPRGAARPMIDKPDAGTEGSRR